jgi:hypothetical protein
MCALLIHGWTHMDTWCFETCPLAPTEGLGLSFPMRLSLVLPRPHEGSCRQCPFTT